MTALLVVGIVLVVLGTILLLVRREEISEGKGFGFEIKGPTGFVVMVLGIACIVLNYWAPWQDKDSAGKTAVSPASSQVTQPATTKTSSTTATTVTGPTIRIISPKDGIKIAGKSGVTIKGTASGPTEGQSLWVFDYVSGQYYRTNYDPISIDNGSWEFTDAPIGDGSNDVGQNFTIVVARGSTKCARAVRSKGRDVHNVIFDTLPSGCVEVGKLTVHKVAP